MSKGVETEIGGGEGFWGCGFGMSGNGGSRGGRAFWRGGGRDVTACAEGDEFREGFFGFCRIRFGFAFYGSGGASGCNTGTWGDSVTGKDGPFLGGRFGGGVELIFEVCEVEGLRSGGGEEIIQFGGGNYVGRGVMLVIGIPAGVGTVFRNLRYCVVGVAFAFGFTGTDGERSGRSFGKIAGVAAAGDDCTS